MEYGSFNLEICVRNYFNTLGKWSSRFQMIDCVALWKLSGLLQVQNVDGLFPVAPKVPETRRGLARIN